MKSVKVYLDNLEILHDISFAISCTQDYRDTIDTTTADGIKEYDNVTDRIGRLFTFYNQLMGFEQIYARSSMRIINERRSQIDGNTLISCILEYNGKLFKISDCPTKLFIWSELNGWLFIDYGDTKETTQKSIEQFVSIMKAYTNENI